VAKLNGLSSIGLRVLILLAVSCAGDVDRAVAAPTPVTPEPTSLSRSVVVAADDTGTPPDDETALINWSDNGVVVRSVGGDLRTVTTAPATAAVLFGDGTVVYQSAPALLHAIGPDLDTEIRSAPGMRMELLDGRHVNDVRQILATTAVARPVGHDDAEQRLLLIDLDSGIRHDLGRVGGFESSVFTGRFTVNTIAAMRSNDASFELLLYDHNGELRHTVRVGTDGFFDITALSPGDELAVFKNGELTLVDAWTGEDRATVAGEWPCRGEVWAGPTLFYCSQPDGPVRVNVGSQAVEPLEWAPTGMVAPAVPVAAPQQQVQLGVPGPGLSLKQVGLSPDRRFRYFVDEVDAFVPVQILVDDGSGLRPATADPRDLYRISPWIADSVQLEFVDETTVVWSAAATGSMTNYYIGRIDDTGMIRDITSGQMGLKDFEVSAVMTSGRDLGIDDNEQLAELMEEPEAYTAPFEGGWFVGNTLASEGECGDKTLYRTTADGHARVLPASVEIDEPVRILTTEVFSGLNVDSVATHRAVAVSVRCPDSYDGVRVHLLIETIGYGDGGPRTARGTLPLIDGSLRLGDGTDTFADVSGLSAVGRNCDFAQTLEVGLQTLDGRWVVVQTAQWPGEEHPRELTNRTLVAPETPETILCDAE